MNIPKSIQELVATASKAKLADYEMALWYDAYANHYKLQYRSDPQWYSIYQDENCLVKYDRVNKLQIIESDQRQIAQQEINCN